METKNIKAFGTEAAKADLKEMTIQRMALTPHDVEIEILLCGICHLVLHLADYGSTAAFFFASDWKLRYSADFIPRLGSNRKFKMPSTLSHQ